MVCVCVSVVVHMMHVSLRHLELASGKFYACVNSLSVGVKVNTVNFVLL